MKKKQPANPAVKLMQDWWKKLQKIPRPESDAELETLCRWYFKVPLHVTFDVYGNSGGYQVVEKYNSYHGKGFDFWEGCTYGYDHSAHFWKHVFGPLQCGGIASVSYGQFKFTGHRNKARLMRWQDSRKRKQSNSLRPFFVRLAREVGAGENSAIRGGAVHITGREGAAVGAS